MDIIIEKFVAGIVAAYEAVSAHQEEINKLNVFPIPDGDTGTNVTLTMQNVVKELQKLPKNADKSQVLRAVKQGSLMGARGNSGVITSQILRGIVEGVEECDVFDPKSVAVALNRARDVAYKAVRKPVEGTILTVVKDMAEYAQTAVDEGFSIEEILHGVAKVAMESVKHTPELMPVLKENGVVDSGGLALAVMTEGFVGYFATEALGMSFEDASRAGFGMTSSEDSVFHIHGHHLDGADGAGGAGVEGEGASNGTKVAIEQNNDWEDHNFRYCTEFLFKSDTLDVEEAYTFLESIGDCQLVVGEHPDFKVHVHTDQPGNVLNWMIERGQPHEIFIHNMDMQSEERLEKIEAEGMTDAEQLTNAANTAGSSDAIAHASSGAIGVNDTNVNAPSCEPKKPIGMVAVAVGKGNVAILESLGVDKIVSGGQTMNPSTADIVEAVDAINAESVIIFPGNKNIIMSANAAVSLANKPCGVVPTTSIPQTFTAIFSGNLEDSLDENIHMMSEAIEDVVTGEVTTAVKDAVGDGGIKIKNGDVMGIIGGAIKLVGSDVYSTCIQMLDKMIAENDPDNLTLLAGEDMPDDEFEKMQDYLEEKYPELEVDANRGEQPLYPLVASVE